MNPNLKVHTLNVKSFRGINHEISLQLGDITIIKGENGTGKSSFVNAIEYLFSNDLAFLKNKTINTNRAAFNWLAEKDDAKIELKFKKKKYVKFENSKRENSIIFNDILKNTYIRNASFILNRKKLLNFIDGTQGDRYKAVMELCGIDKIDKIQSTISASKSTIKRDLDKISEMYENKLTNLSSILTDKHNLSLDECISELNKRLKDNGKDTIEKETDISGFINSLDLSDTTIILSKINDFKRIHDQLDISQLKIKLDNTLNEYEELASDNLKSYHSLLETLQNSFDYIELTNSDICPVCENTINPSEILPEISKKIEDMNENNSKFDNWKCNINQLIFDVESEIDKCKNLNMILDDLNKFTSNAFFKFNFDILINFKDDLNNFLDFKKVPSDFNEFKFDSLNDEITSIKDNLFEYESSQNLDDLSEIYNMLFTIKDLKELEARIFKLTEQFNVVSKTFEIFIKTKEDFIKNMISEIRDDIKNYYEFIHGNDLITAPDIKLTGPKLIDVYLNSFGDLVDSRSFASEGHLDTLGICIFLAFNKKFNEIPFIVFDDVLTTVDLPHKERIGRLIVDQLVDYQFLITTHSSLWAEQLKRLCIDSKRNHIIHELIDWTLEEGPITSKQLDSEDKIEKYLSNNHRDFEAAGNTARRYLEYTLTQICIANNVKVPINDKYDVGTLFDEAKNYTLRIVQGTSLEPYYAHIWGEINKTRYIANILSHYNKESSQLPKNDVKKFCEDVINLNHAYKCDCGKSFLKLDPKSNKLICSNEKCRDTVDMNSFSEIDFGYSEGKVEL
ncbi:MAG: DUF2813 domain-containing protein [Methanobrevibacter sp.]|uniref:DUF2813 domain-containing protein n=1 Tax=Methanobrevibacter sp. TaxID=66852 RepID=UPI002E795F87|nr:DUF2813 domain-containing protein [Methanobrevibacter sp.]MEE0943343.1 DUF2813 domain-containing protein [Methanobrevibacter sp.]